MMNGVELLIHFLSTRIRVEGTLGRCSTDGDSPRSDIPEESSPVEA
jgi:hypothetical protein